MLVLFESAAGYGVFRMADDGQLSEADVVNQVGDIEGFKQIVDLHEFQPFGDITEALDASTALVEGDLSKSLKKFLKKAIVKPGLDDELAVADAKLGGIIKDKLGISCVTSSVVNQVMRGLRLHLSDLVPELNAKDVDAMQLGVAHSLSRYKLKFSIDKVDVMIVQAIGLLDDLDKELNTYSMRLREWYGWHFPELSKLIAENVVYARLVRAVGFRTNFGAADLAPYLEEELHESVQNAAQRSMGTEITEADISHIHALCDQIIEIGGYRAELFEYLKARMTAIAPNLTIMVGELVGARLIAHAGSLINLAKHPASTVQILGAEKALFRALKTHHDTPKYGLIYHASVVGQANPKNKGKISRVLAAKASLAVRCDALGDADTPMIGVEARAKVDARLRQLEGKPPLAAAAEPPPTSAYTPNATSTYNDAGDSVGVSKKRRREEDSDDAEEATPKRRKVDSDEGEKKKKKKKKSKKESDAGDAEGKKKKKKKKSKKAE